MNHMVITLIIKFKNSINVNYVYELLIIFKERNVYLMNEAHANHVFANCLLCLCELAV